MKGIHLRFYVHENRRHRGILLYEWLLERAKKLGIHGGSAFRSVAGFGRHGVLHEEHFFELAGDLTMEIEFLVSDDDANRLIASIQQEKIRLFYARVPMEFGVINAEQNDYAPAPDPSGDER
jgi:PII-like signaling protein